MEGLSARQRRLIKTYQLDGYDDEFHLLGREPIKSDYIYEEVPIVAPTALPSVDLAIIGCGIAGTILIALLLRIRTLNNAEPAASCETKDAGNKTKTDVKTKTTDTSEDREIIAEPMTNSKAILDQVTPESGTELVELEKSPTGERNLRQGSNSPDLPPTLVQESCEDYCRDVASHAASFQEALKSSGITNAETLATLSIQAAIAKKQTDDMQRTHFQTEQRHYYFHAQQSFMHRKQSDAQHQATMSVLRTDQQWLSKLNSAHSQYMNALKQGFITSSTLIVGVPVALPFLNTLLLWRCSSYLEFSQYLLEQFNVSSWVVSFVVEMLSEDLLEGSYCFLHSVSAFSVNLITIATVASLMRFVGMPAGPTAIFVALVCLVGWKLDMFVAVCLLLLSAMAILLVLYASAAYQAIKCQLEEHGSPSTSVVNDAVAHFSQLSIGIRLGVGCVLVMSVVREAIG